MADGFLQKNLHQAKMTKNGQKPSKKRVLGFLKKTKLLVLSGIGVKRKFLWSSNVLWKMHAWKKSGS